MIATDSTIICSPLQRTARRLLLAACCILLMGVMGAAADRTIDREHNSATPAVSVAPTPMLAAATAPIAAASTHSAVDFDALADSAAPAAAVEITSTTTSMSAGAKTAMSWNWPRSRTNVGGSAGSCSSV